MSKWDHYQQKPGTHRWRWRNHIEPLVDHNGDGRLFLDLGCNAGYYMRRAKEYGYRTMGVESDKQSIALSPDLDIIHGDINWIEPRCAYLTLLACIHYHQSPEQAEALFHALSHSTVYLIVMGRHKGAPRSNPTKDHLLKHIITGFDVVDERNSRLFYSVLLKNRRCTEFNIDDLYAATRSFTGKLSGYDDWVPGFEEFVRHSLADIDYDAAGSAWMAYLNRRGINYKIGRCWMYKRMIKDIQKDQGLAAAIKLRGGRVSDGMHRLIVLRELGFKKVVCRAT